MLIALRLAIYTNSHGSRKFEHLKQVVNHVFTSRTELTNCESDKHLS